MLLHFNYPSFSQMFESEKTTYFIYICLPKEALTPVFIIYSPLYILLCVWLIILVDIQAMAEYKFEIVNLICLP